ncbi:MAG: dicarboxylate/amino acid:cation symporter, partial [Prochlorococcus sp.]
MQPLRWFVKQNLAIQIFEGLLLGLAAGLLLPHSIVSLLAPIGDGFLRLFQMPVLPFLSLSLIAGVGRLNMDQAGRLLLRAASVLMGFWAVVLLAVLLMPLGFPNWQQASFYRPSLLEAAKPLNLLELFIPVNPFAAYAKTQIPAVMLFSLALGIALILVPNRQPLIDIFDRLSDGLLKISSFVSRFTPLGIFAILASSIAALQPSTIPRLGVYLILQGGLAILLAFAVLPLLVQGLTALRGMQLLRSFRSPLTIAFATANLLVVLPLMMSRAKDLLVEARSEDLGIDSNDSAGKAKVLEEIELPVEVLTPLAL